MPITNVRLGFATNSSSSHSIVLTNRRYSDDSGNSYGGNLDFGWESFTLASQGSKLPYIALILRYELESFLPRAEAAGVVYELLKDVQDRHFSRSELAEGYIDHQSILPLPADMSPEGRFLYMRRLARTLMNSNVVIFGGNDNSEGSSHEAESDEIEVPSGPLHIREDGDALVIFNRFTGAKLRWSPREYTKASYPELVDIKITDYCPYGCAFCYQGSTQAGKDKVKLSVGALMETLAENGVFEVALGGGEPTTSNNFKYFINSAVELGIVPNFTTFAVDWLQDDEKLKAARKCGGIGVSVHRDKDLSKAERIREALSKVPSSLPRTKVMVQHVFGTLPVGETVSLVTQAWYNDFPVLLLGYKNTGFGPRVTPHDMKGFAAKLKDSSKWLRDSKHSRHACELSCDTAFVDSNTEFLSEYNVPVQLTTSPEGAFSCYVDAVEGLVGPSSYCSKDSMVPVDYPINLRPMFAKF